jgi:arylsulfatase A
MSPRLLPLAPSRFLSRFVRRPLALAGALLLSVVPALRAATATPSPLPNIVILYADDMGYGDLAIQNPDSKIRTPHLDRLAREGMRFTDAHSSSGICTPSRYALLTGRFHWRKFHGIVQSFGPPSFDDAELTLPELLRSRGYRTACIGKWHLGWDWDAVKRPGAKADPKTGYAPDAFDWSKRIPGGPLSHGFDSYFGDDVPNFPPYAWFENDRVVTPPTVPLAITPQTAEGAWEARPGPMVAGWDFHAVMPRLTERAEQFIAARKGEKQPFFLYFPFTSPHAPIVPSPEFAGKSQAGGYGDFMEQTDATVGRVLAALAAHGFADNTLVIFSADNGPEHYAYPRIQNFNHRSAGPLRGLKRDLWEGGHRVPFLVRWPGRVPAGTVSAALTSQIDLMATLAAVVGAPLPPGTAHDSHNQLEVWTKNAPGPRRTLVHNTNANGYALRHDQWLYIAAKTGAVSKVPAWFDPANRYAPHTEPGELYDLSVDLAQRDNLHAKNPAKVSELAALLAQVRAQGQIR